MGKALQSNLLFNLIISTSLRVIPNTEERSDFTHFPLPLEARVYKFTRTSYNRGKIANLSIKFIQLIKWSKVLMLFLKFTITKRHTLDFFIKFLWIIS